MNEKAHILNQNLILPQCWLSRGNNQIKGFTSTSLPCAQENKRKLFIVITRKLASYDHFSVLQTGPYSAINLLRQGNVCSERLLEKKKKNANGNSLQKVVY